MMMRTAFLSSCLVMGLFACKGEKVTDQAAVEYAEDIGKICNAKELSGAGDQDPSQVAVKMAEYLKSAIKTKKARDMMANMGSLAPGARAAKLRDEAKKAGLESCALADEK